MKIILFIDALDVNDLSPWFKENLITVYNPGVPKVTPNVISQVMTGLPQADLPFMRSTPYKGPRFTHLRAKTILHHMSQDMGLKIFSYGMPLCSNLQLPQGSISVYDHLFNGRQAIPGGLDFIHSRSSFMTDDREIIFHGFVDETATMFSSFRTYIRNNSPDIVMIGYHFVDAYTHWYDEENKQRLVQYLEVEIKEMKRFGDILFFSDHGSTEQIACFHINKWLYDKGYLTYEIYEKLMDQHLPPNRPFSEQITLDAQFVWTDWGKTKFFCVDAFDAMTDATEHATDEDKDQICVELMETGMFNSVKRKEDVLGRNGEYYDQLPSIIPDSAEGVLVSSNIHPNAETGKNFDNMRGGWHSERGVVGCTDKSLKTVVNRPQDIYDLIREFAAKEEGGKSNAEIQENQPNRTALDGLFNELDYM